jgi:hypothetical protein
MRDTKWHLWTAIALGLTTMAVVSPTVRPAQSSLNKKELNALIVSAKTPQDHERLAAYYRSEEQSAKGKQAEHEEMLRRYRNNPLSHRFTKVPSPEDHCRTLIRIFGDEAHQDAALAEYHEKIAASLSKKQ